MNRRVKFVHGSARWLGAIALLLAFTGCAHVGAIPKSPCACVFHPLAAASVMTDRARA